MNEKKEPLLSIIIATIGRPTLERTLASIPMLPAVEVVLVGDGLDPDFIHFLLESDPLKFGVMPLVTRWPRARDYGYSALNIGLVVAAGKWVTLIGDDDYYTRNGVLAMIDYCQRETVPGVFRMKREDHGDTLWAYRALVKGNVGGQQFVCPNRFDLPRFETTRYEADFNWMVDVGARYPRVNWVDQVTVIAPKANHEN